MPAALIRAVSRIALAAVFLDGGRHVWNNPDGPAGAAGPLLTDLRRTLPPLHRFSDRQLVRLNAAVHLGGGVGLATGVAPAASALLLAGSLVPTTLAAFPFWTQPAGPERGHQRANLLKNLALAGGLLAVAVARSRPAQPGI